MSAFQFPLSILLLLGLAAVSLLCGLLVWPQLSAAWPSIQDKIDQFRRLPPLAKLLLVLFVGVFVVFGSTKTNQVSQTSGTNVVEIVEGGTNDVTEIDSESDTNEVDVAKGDITNTPPMMLMMTKPSFGDNSPTVTPEDIARGWQLWEVRTSCNVSYTMPENAMMASNWWMRGAFEDCSIVRLGDCSIGGYVSQSNNPNNQTMSFPFGTNEYDSAWAFTWGKVRFALGDAETEIVAVGAPMSAVPYRSRLWIAADTNDSRFVTWEDFALNRDTNTPVNAQVELRTTGDFIVRSNEIEKVYHRIDDFDWDGDGIRNGIDGEPFRYDGDYTGQEDWWREYVDEMVGTGLENGYYKLTATFPQEGFRRAVLNVGVNEIVVAEPGEYVFLLEKGNDYDIGLEPFADGVAFEAVDDIPGPMPRLFAGLEPSWTGRWSEDPGRCILDPPTTRQNGHVLWLPKLRVLPGVWNPTDDSLSETFTAELYDHTGNMAETDYLWLSCHNSLDVYSSYSYSTEMAWRWYGQVAGTVARLEVCIAGERLESELRFDFSGPGDSDDEDEPRVNVDFAMSVPEALLVNSNAAATAKEGRICMSIQGDIPADGRLVLRRKSGADRVRFLESASWPLTCAAVREGRELQLDIEGVQASTSLRDVELEAVLRLPDGDHVCGRSRLTVIEVGGVIFFDDSDGRPVVAPNSRVPFGLEIFPAAATSLVWTEYDVRHLNESGEFSGWQRVGYGDTDTTECGFRPTSRGVWQVRGTAGLEPEGCPYGTDERDTLFGSDEPAYVYVPREPRLVFDYDRDGVIGTNDVAKAKAGNTTFRFWINDDNDSGDVCAASDYCSDTPGQSTKNCQDGQVNGRRDLLDFTPVWMDFSNVFPTGTPAQVWNKVEWRLASTCVNVVWSNLGRNNAGSFQRDGDLYEFGPQLNNLAESAIATCIADGVVVPDSLRGTSESDGGVFLIEGSMTGFDLTLEGWRTNRSQNEQEWLVTSEADISVTSVEDMYRWKNLRGVCGNAEGRTSYVDSPWNRPDSECDGRHFVFVHGFNVNSEEARASAAEVFKRLWQSGSDSMFTAVEWYGNQEQTDIVEDIRGTISLNYYANALHAFETASALVSACASLPGQKVIIAHSLGNMLVSSAAVDHGLVYDRYYMLNAAVAMEAYDSTEQAADMVDSTWAADGVPAAYRASRWSGLFGPEDFRSKLTWRGRFAGITNAVNCYSETEDVVGNPRQAFTVLGETSWVMQEYLKGDSRLHAINLIPGSHISCEGGWGRNSHYPLWLTLGSMLGISGLTREDVIEHPLFTPFRNEAERMSSTNLFSVTDTAATPELRARILADAIPAESCAAGANRLKDSSGVGNIPLMGFMANNNGWPEKDKDDNLAWKHSSFKQTAYFFTYKLFDYFVKGN